MGLQLHSQLKTFFVDIEVLAVKGGCNAFFPVGASQMIENSLCLFQEKSKVFHPQTGEFLWMDVLASKDLFGCLHQHIHDFV